MGVDADAASRWHAAASRSHGFDANPQHPAGMPPMAGVGPHGPMAGMAGNRMAQRGGMPAQPGQAAFGAIQEIVAMLEADPQTDWTKVDIDALRQHLIDMDEVTINAVAHKEPIDNGLRIELTGSGRTLTAIQRMVPDHAREIDGKRGWTVRTASLPDGVTLTVTAADPAEVQKIRALGFMGIMVQGMHHGPHHLAMARGLRSTSTEDGRVFSRGQPSDCHKAGRTERVPHGDVRNVAALACGSVGWCWGWGCGHPAKVPFVGP